tara:strand:- start:33092 stop:37312 length:4221 start_codon:yes stop_codon:yes gene_type:complete
MPENAFTDLIPRAAPEADPFSDLVPSAPAAGAGAFDDLVPPSVHEDTADLRTIDAMGGLADTAPSAVQPPSTVQPEVPVPAPEEFAFKQALQDLYAGAIEKPARNFKAGYLSSASGTYNLGANALMLVNRMSDYLAETTGVGVKRDDPESAFGRAERWLRETAAKVAPDAKDIDDDTIGKIYQGLGAAPIAVGEYGIAGALGGPVAGMAAVDALHAADQGPVEAGKAAAKGALLGGVLKATEPLSRPARAGSMAAVGGTAAAAEGGDASDIAAGAVTMGALGAIAPGGRITLRSAARDAFADLVPQRQAQGGPGPMADAMRGPETMPDAPAMAAKAPGARRSEPGVNYIGQIADAPGVATAVSPKPLRRETVLGPLFKDLGAALYEGRVKGEKALGFYRPGIEEVRTKRKSDIETAAHEAAHLIDDRFPEVRRMWAPATKENAALRDELRGVSYDKSKLYEGFAEFVRLWSTQREQARAKAPEFFARFEDFVARNQHGQALRKFQDDAHAWFEQDALNRARSKIGAAPEINAHLNSLGDRFRQAVSDDLHGVYKMERDLTGKIAPVGAYETARLSRAAHSITEGALTIGAPRVMPDGSHTFAGKGLQQILDPVTADLDNFLMYAVGRSARELHSQGREHLFTKAEIDAMTRLETPAFRQVFQDYQNWNRSVLDFAQAKGLIAGRDRAKWRRNDYLPFHRVGQKVGSGGGPQGDWRGIKALTGGTENLRGTLNNLIQNAATLIDAALKNEARLKVAQLAKTPGGARFMAKIPADDARVKVHVDDVKREFLKAMGVKDIRALPVETQRHLERAFDDMAPFATFLQRNQAPFGDNVVAVMRAGKPEFYEVADPILFRSLTALNRPARNFITRLLSVPKRVGQTSITLTADFMAANFARDTLMGAIMSRHGFKPLIDSARGLMSRAMEDPNYKAFVANGGGFSSYYLDEGAFRTHIERFYTAKGIDPRTVIDAPAKMLYFLERLGDAFEMSTRLGEFSQAMKKGEHPRHAAYSAREVSTDFAMRGDSEALNFMYDTVIFLKAGVNGMDRLYRGLAHDPNRTAIAGKAALLAAVSAGLYAWNRDIPAYQDLEDWDKDSNWHFFVPKEDGEHHHFRYPKIWEMGAAASIAERQLEGILNDQPLEAQQHTLRVFRDLFKLEYLPQAVAPLAEQAMNRIRFLDRPIETESMKNLAPWARSGPYTSRTMQALGEATRDFPRALQISPARAEALLRGYLNTWAMYGLTLADAALFDDMPDLRADQYPVVRRFYSQEPARNTKHVTAMYDAITAATEARRTLRHLDRINRPELADEIEHKAENLAYSQMSNAQKTLRAIRREMAQAQRATKLPEIRHLIQERARITKKPAMLNELRSSPAWDDIGALKRRLQDDLTAERNAFAKKVMKEVEGVSRGR